MSATLVYVKLRKNETSERLIKRFSKKVRREGVIDELKDRMYYEKPSVKRRKAAIRRKRTLENLKKEKRK